MRTLPGGPAAQNLDRLVPWLEQDRLYAGYTPSGPQTRSRRNVARGVEVQRGTPPLRRRRAGPRAPPRMNQFSVISSHESILISDRSVGQQSES